MTKEIIEQLKTKFEGLSDNVISRVAKTIAKTATTLDEVKTAVEGLTSQMVQARLNTADAKQFLLAKYFPVKRVNGFVWKTLQSQIANTNVAADLHTDNGTIARKRRPVFESAQGDIPFISISRELTRSEIKDYQTALAFARDTDAAKLVQYCGNDVDFCFNGVQSENLENPRIVIFCKIIRNA